MYNVAHLVFRPRPPQRGAKTNRSQLLLYTIGPRANNFRELTAAGIRGTRHEAAPPLLEMSRSMG
jgi:hypothetical protein